MDPTLHFLKSAYKVEMPLGPSWSIHDVQMYAGVNFASAENDEYRIATCSYNCHFFQTPNRESKITLFSLCDFSSSLSRLSSLRA
jgi:hypothetical protein